MERMNRRALCALVLAPAFFLWTAHGLGEDAPERPDPPGPHLKKVEPAALARTSFRRDQAIAGTYYFYWYDSTTKEHFVDEDGSDALTDHPEKAEGYSYRSPEWHHRELLDVRDAGLDFILPVYWGYPNGYGQWSFTGIPPLVEACRRFEAEGKTPPRIGLFYDTSTLQWNHRGFHADLSTKEGKEWLYVSARDFYSMVPHDLWAAVESRPFVWLYSASFARKQDAAALDYLREEFRKDFGVEPFIVKESSWKGRADAAYSWGAALNPGILGVAAVGPGYDHSSVPGRSPLVRDREGGAFYSRSWELVLSRDPTARPKIAIVETWNEFHEGTEIAPTKEYGRRYVDLTRKYSGLWRAGAKVERPGPFAKAESVSVVLGGENRSEGLAQREHDDGKTEAASVAGKSARRTAGPGPGRYIYFDVDDSFFSRDDGNLELEVVVYDGQKGDVILEYDSTDDAAPHGGAFKALRATALEGTGRWKSCSVKIRDAAFGGRSNGNDFRFSGPEGELAIHRVSVKKMK